MECRGIVFDPRLPKKTSLLAIALIVAASLGFASLPADERAAPKTPEVAYTNGVLIWTFGGDDLRVVRGSRRRAMRNVEQQAVKAGFECHRQARDHAEVFGALTS